MNWWEAAWWAGVQGVTSILGALAISIAVADFMIRANRESPRAMAFSVSRERGWIRDQSNDWLDVTVRTRPMGEHVLYEPRWRVWGIEHIEIPDMPPVLDVRSDPETLELRVPRDLLPLVWIGVEWVVPRRYGSFAAAARVEVKQNGAYERWEIFRWWRWPRKEAGRWIRGRDISKRSPLQGPR